MSEELATGDQPQEPSVPSSEPEAAVSQEQVLADAREDALDFVEGLLDAMDADGDVAAAIVEDRLEVSISGADSGLLIGKRGQTLDAIQELLRTVIQRQAQTRVRVTLDIEGYRERRREALVLQTQEMADKAIEQGEAEFEPMSSYERKIVHDAAAEIEGVTSFSEGEEPRRRVILKAQD